MCTWVDRNHYVELAILKKKNLILINRKYLGVIVFNHFIIIYFCNFLNYCFTTYFLKYLFGSLFKYISMLLPTH
jgi:hypothetical protein